LEETLKQTVVVTGTAGFVGAHVARAFAVQGYRVIANDLAATLPEHVMRGLHAPDVEYVAGDLRSESTLDALVAAAGPSVTVVHVAALIRFAELGAALGEAAPVMADAVEVFEINSMATWRLVSKFFMAGTLNRFVYVSTRSVFGALEVDEDVIVESSPQRPIGIYGSSKAAAEIGVLALRDVFNLDLVVARITGVFGPWQGPVSWIGKAIEGVTSGEGYHASAGGNDRYELTYIKDTAKGIVDVAVAEQLAYPIYHVSSSTMHSLDEVAEAFRADDRDADVDFGTSGVAGMRRRLPLGNERIATELGFTSTWDLQSAIADYLLTERTGSYGVEVTPSGGASS
jgi:nucleoside-diphosphate-sugar epimerase